MMFSAQEMRHLAGLSLERQVIEILLEQDEPMKASELQAQLMPKPSNDAMQSLLDKLRARKEIADYPSNSQILAPLIGLPGWTQRVDQGKPEPKPESKLPFKNTDPATLAPPSPAIHPWRRYAPSSTTTKENSMSKTKRAPRVSAEKADQAVETLLQNATEPLTVASIARDAELNTTAAKAAVKRLAKRGRITAEGRGTKAAWSKAASQTAQPVTATAVAAPTATAPRKTTNGKARFGFFNDGEVVIEAPRCTGILSREEFAALREYSEKHEEAA